MNISRPALITAKFAGRCVNGTKFKRGEQIVMFPRARFAGLDEDGNKKFLNAYMKLGEMKQYAWMKPAVKILEKKWGMKVATV